MAAWDPARRIVLDVPGMGEIARERLSPDVASGVPSPIDVYRPVTGLGPPPAVLFVHGDADPEALRGAADWGQYVSWAEAVAARGMAAVVFEHSSSEGCTQIPRVLAEVSAMLRYLAAEGASIGIDPARLAVWTCSGGVPYGVTAALQAPATVRCIVAYYGMFDLRPLRRWIRASVTDRALADASPAALVERGAQLPPMLVARAGRDRTQVTASIDAWAAGPAGRAPGFQLVVHPSGHHGFDVLDDDDTSRRIISATLDFLASNLAGSGPSADSTPSSVAAAH